MFINTFCVMISTWILITTKFQALRAYRLASRDA